MKEVNLFVILINSAEIRLAEPLRKALERYEATLKSDFWKNVCIVFTRWSNDPNELLKKEREAKAANGPVMTKERA